MEKVFRSIKIKNSGLKFEASVELIQEDDRWYVRIVFGDDSSPLLFPFESQALATPSYDFEARKLWKNHGWRV